MNGKARKATIWFLGASVFLGGVVPPAVMYVYDPIMIFHRPWGRDMTFHDDMRLQAAGVINNVVFDSVILGTSMLENSSAREAGELLGGTFVNLSISGGGFFERSIILDHLFRMKKVKHVIYSLDDYPEAGNSTYPIEEYAYLYDNIPFNDFKVYTADNFIQCVLVYSIKPGCIGGHDSLDRPNAWYMQGDHAARFGGINNWFLSENSDQIRNALLQISEATDRIRAGKLFSIGDTVLKEWVANATSSFDAHVLKFVRAYPETDFHMIFPPYSRIRYAQWHQLKLPTAFVHEAMNRYLTGLSMALPNLYVYGFEDQEFVDNIAYYKDTVHYHYDINSMMLRAIRDGNHLLRPEMIEEYLGTARARAHEFNLLGLGNMIDAYLQHSEEL